MDPALGSVAGSPNCTFIVIPAYNEGAVLGQTISEVLSYGYQVIIVDDGSEVPAMQYLGDAPVHCLRHVTNIGQGAALQTGMDYALLKGADIIVHFDADGQHDPALIGKLIQPICSGECDVVMGSRFLDPEDQKLVPLYKQYVLKLGVLVSWVFAGLRLSDTHNGFRALSRSAAQQIRLTEDGFAHATQILELIRKSKLKYKEIPSTTRYSAYSRSKGQSVFNSLNIVFDLFLRKLLG